jgi:hypothetical protein|tara:strand:- start:827 stop:1582 length:756 start_codon:yes stop_codon:yes gene_type:complete
MEYKKIFRSKLAKNLRNFLGFKPAHFLIDYEKTNMSVSDAFFWRTDNTFKTIFSFSDILNLYFKDDTSRVEILFYNKYAELIKTFKIANLKLTNKLLIDSFFLNGITDYGTFYIYHKSNKDIGTSIRNSCYTGYSFKNNLSSFVHGNTLTSYTSYNNEESHSYIAGKSTFQKQIYQVQNNYNFEKTEIMLMNPCNETILIEVNKEFYELQKGSSKLINIKDDQLIKIKSKCYLLRPVVFNYQGIYLDVHHG